MRKETRFMIFVKDVTGQIVQAVTWTKDPKSGVDTIRRQVPQTVMVKEVWAEPI